jgi:multicomponent Na+:H+ antiporter subunit B
MRRIGRLRIAVGALACAGFTAVVLLSIGRGEAGGETAPFLRVAATGAANRVASIVLDIRLYDTLFELFAFSVAVLGVRRFLRRTSGPAAEETLVESHVVRRAAHILFPPMLVLGAYLACFGHLSPGGGFGGGAVAATGVLLVSVALGADVLAQRFRDERLERLEGAVLMVLLLIALCPVAWSRPLLSNLLAPGRPGSLLSAGTIPIYSVLVAIKVFAGAWAVVHFFVRHRGEV